MNWLPFWQKFLTDDAVFAEFCGKLPKDIFENAVQSNLLELAYRFDDKYFKRPTFGDMLMMLGDLPDHEKANIKTYEKTLNDIAAVVTDVSTEVLIDKVYQELGRFVFERNLIKIVNKITPGSDYRQLAYQFMETVEKAPRKPLGDSFDNSFFMEIDQAIDRQNRDLARITPDKLVKYSVPALNECLLGIFPGELVVVGAESGVGKTQFGADTARINAMAGKKTYLICLEGSKNEVISRFKYEIIAREYFSPENPNKGMPMSYPLYLANGLRGIERFEAIAEKELAALRGKLVIYGKNESDLRIDKLLQQLGRIQDADLVVVDHLHYFGMEDDSSEASQLSGIMRKVKDLTQARGIPVLMFSHLRRKARDKKMPDNDDFHGSSNIAKIADTTLLIVRQYDGANKDVSPTIFCVGKSRNGWDPFYGWLVDFDRSLRSYSAPWDLVKIHPWKDPEAVASDNWPKYIIDIVGVEALNRVREREAQDRRTR